MASLKAWLALAACGAAAFTGSAAAQTARSGGSASAQLMQQMQQLASERTTLQAENDKLKARLADLTKERDGLKAGEQALDRKAKDTSAALSRSAAERETADKELAQSKAKMQELIGKFRETIEKLRESEAAGTAVRQSLATREHQLASCVNNNQALIKMNDEILTRLERSGVSDPITHLHRIRLENYAEETREQAREHLVSAPAGLPAQGAPAPAAAAPAVQTP